MTHHHHDDTPTRTSFEDLRPQMPRGPMTSTDQAVAQAAARVGGHVGKGLQTLVGYGGAALAALAVLLDPVVNPDLPPHMRVALLAAAAFLAAVTGKNRSDQAQAKDAAAGQVIATAKLVEARALAALPEPIALEAVTEGREPVVVNVHTSSPPPATVDLPAFYEAQGADDLPPGGQRRPGEDL